MHIYLTDWFVDLVRSFCGDQDLWARKEVPITIRSSEPEPDLSVIEGKRSDFRYKKPHNALFVAKIAISSFSIDAAKASDYAAAEIPEYWIIRPDEKQVRVFREPSEGKYQLEQDFDDTQGITWTDLNISSTPASGDPQQYHPDLEIMSYD